MARDVSNKAKTDSDAETASRIDRNQFVVDAEAFGAFQAALAEPAVRNERLAALLRRAPPWEE